MSHLRVERPDSLPAAPDRPGRQSADLRLRAGPARLRVRVDVTPAGLVAIGGLVSSILLSTAVLVWSATAVPRRHPVASALRR